MNWLSIKLSLRQLWKQKLFTFLHIMGLAIGIAGCFSIARIVDYELKYDREHPEKDKIYQVLSYSFFEGKESYFGGIQLPVSSFLEDERSETTLIVPIHMRYFNKIKTNEVQGDHLESPTNLMSTTTSYFDLVPYRWLAGNKKTVFNTPNEVVLTESRAKLYFNDTAPQDIIGQTITYNDSLLYTVTGIIEDLHFPSSFNGKEFFSIPEKDRTSTDWDSRNSAHQLYIKISNDKAKAALLSAINKKIDHETAEAQKTYKFKTWFDLLPLDEKHFTPSANNSSHTTDRAVLYILLSIAVFLIALASINYINLTTAQMSKRAKLIGIQKSLGADSSGIIQSFFVETILILLGAFVLAIPLTQFFNENFKEIIPKDIGDFLSMGEIIVFALALLILLSLINGLYPAWLSTKVSIVKTLKSQQVNSKQKTGLRKVLIVFQFTIAQLFVICTLIIAKQLHYAFHADLGFNHNAVIIQSLPSGLSEKDNKDARVYRQALQRHPEFSMVSLGQIPFDNSMWSTRLYRTLDTGEVTFNIENKFIDENYFDLYDIKLLAGEKFLQLNDSSTHILINEKAVLTMGFESAQDALGQVVEKKESSEKRVDLRIIGVVKNFNQNDFRSEIAPMAFYYREKDDLKNISVKLTDHNKANWTRAIQIMETEWKNLYPQKTFEYKFYDQHVEEMYESYTRTAKLINTSTAVTLMISCIGLFGLITLTSYQRTKEIGIRKIMGARDIELFGLLTKDYIWLVVIASLIASPIAYYFMNNWLKEFTFRIDLTPWDFALAGIACIIIALVTTSIQAIRAIRQNPVNSLRDE